MFLNPTLMVHLKQQKLNPSSTFKCRILHAQLIYHDNTSAAPAAVTDKFVATMSHSHKPGIEVTDCHHQPTGTSDKTGECKLNLIRDTE